MRAAGDLHCHTYAKEGYAIVSVYFSRWRNTRPSVPIKPWATVFPQRIHVPLEKGKRALSTILSAHKSQSSQVGLLFTRKQLSGLPKAATNTNNSSLHYTDYVNANVLE